MNPRTYYQKIREVERTLLEPFVVLFSHETPDGGREGVLTEVPRPLAARMIVDGRARLAGEAATRQFHEQKGEAKRLAEKEAITNRMQLNVLSTAESRKTVKSSKE